MIKNSQSIGFDAELSFDTGRQWLIGKKAWKFDDSVKAKVEGREEIKIQDANAQ